MLAARGLERPPEDLIEPMNIRIWEAGRHTSFAERARMQAVFNTTSRGFGAFFEQWDIILTPITALPTPKVGTTEYLTISRQSVGAGLVRQSLAQLRLHAARQSLRHPRDLAADGGAEHGLPLGIQAMAKQANDGLLLQLAAQIERAIDGKWNGGRKPKVHVTRLRRVSIAFNKRSLASGSISSSPSGFTSAGLLLALPVHRQRLVEGFAQRQRCGHAAATECAVWTTSTLTAAPTGISRFAASSIWIAPLWCPKQDAPSK